MSLFRYPLLLLCILATIPVYSQIGEAHNWYQCNASSGTHSILVERFDAVLQDGRYVAGKRSDTYYNDIYGFAQDYELVFKSTGLVDSLYYYRDGLRTGAYAHYDYKSSSTPHSRIHIGENRRKHTLNTYTYFGRHKLLNAITGIGARTYKDGIFHIGKRKTYALEYDSLNAEGQVVRSLRKQRDGSNIFTRINSYTSKGCLAKSSWTRHIYNIHHKIAYIDKQEYTYRYSYNQQGDWTRAIVSLNGTPTMIVQRTIQYMQVPTRPHTDIPFDKAMSTCIEYLLKSPHTLELARKVKQGIHDVLRPQHTRFLEQYAHMSSHMKEKPLYRAIIDSDQQRIRYMRTYSAYASNLVDKNPKALLKEDFDQILCPDCRWAGWSIRQLPPLCTGIDLYEMQHKGFKLVMAVNTLAPSAQNNLEVDYLLDGESTSHHTALRAGECKVFCYGGTDDDRVFRKVVKIERNGGNSSI